MRRPTPNGEGTMIGLFGPRESVGDFAVLDVENIGRHYLPTSRYWLSNFRANRHKIDPKQYDARFVRAACRYAVRPVFRPDRARWP